MKIGVLADTHIPDRAKDIPKEILEAFKDVDMIIHAGDLVEPSVLDKLSSICKNVVAVKGNMDHDVRVKDLPEKELLRIGVFRIGIMHGLGGPPDKIIYHLAEVFKADHVDLIIFGHSHVPLNEKRGNIIFFNPGSPTDKVFAPYNSYGIIEIDKTIQAEIIRI